MQGALVALAVAAVVAALLWYGLRLVRPPARPPARVQQTVVEDGRVTVRLDLGVRDESSTAVRRLVDDAAARAFALAPEAQEVEVRNRDGLVVARRTRERPRVVTLPDPLLEPHRRRTTGPDPTDEDRPTAVRPGPSRAPVDPGSAPRRALADRFELPPGVRDRLADPDDPVELVRRLLEAAGWDVEADGDVLRAGTAAVVVVRAPIGEPLAADALNHAYRRYAAAHVREGVVLTPGFLDPVEARRREAFEPKLRHAGPEGIQRMADAVTAGGDPLVFAAPPAA